MPSCKEQSVDVKDLSSMIRASLLAWPGGILSQNEGKAIGTYVVASARIKRVLEQQLLLCFTEYRSFITQ